MILLTSQSRKRNGKHNKSKLVCQRRGRRGLGSAEEQHEESFWKRHNFLYLDCGGSDPTLSHIQKSVLFYINLLIIVQINE